MGSRSPRQRRFALAAAGVPAMARARNGSAISLMPGLAPRMRSRRASRALVQVGDLVPFGCLAGGELAVHRGDLHLEAKPRREPHCCGVGYRDVQLSYPRLQPAAMAALGLRHATEDVRPLRVHPRRDQLVNGSRLDLSSPSGDKWTRTSAGGEVLGGAVIGQSYRRSCRLEQLISDQRSMVDALSGSAAGYRRGSVGVAT